MILLANSTNLADNGKRKAIVELIKQKILDDLEFLENFLDLNLLIENKNF